MRGFDTNSSYQEVSWDDIHRYQLSTDISKKSFLDTIVIDKICGAKNMKIQNKNYYTVWCWYHFLPKEYKGVVQSREGFHYVDAGSNEAKLIMLLNVGETYTIRKARGWSGEMAWLEARPGATWEQS